MTQLLKCCSIKIFQSHSKSWKMSFLKVKVLSELFHFDIELLQMIFSMHVASNTVTSCIVFNSLIHGTCNLVITSDGLSPERIKCPVNKTVPADNPPEFRTRQRLGPIDPVKNLSVVKVSCWRLVLRKDSRIERLFDEGQSGIFSFVYSDFDLTRFMFW